MVKSISFLLLLLVLCSQSFSQYQRFIYADSIGSVAGVSPVPSSFIRQNHIKKMDAYLITKSDSTLTKTFLFDSSGNFIKEIAYTGKHKILNIDSLIYDNRSRKIKEFSVSGMGEISSISETSYEGDSVIITNSSYNHFYNGKDTIQRTENYHTVQSFNQQHQLSKVSSENVSKTNAYLTEYSWLPNGLLEKISRTINEHPKFETLFEHQFNRKGRKVILWDMINGKKIKHAECSYDKNYHCTQYIYYANPENHTDTFRYSADGSLFEHTEESYNPWNKKWSWVTTRYHYYQ